MKAGKNVSVRVGQFIKVWCENGYFMWIADSVC